MDLTALQSFFFWCMIINSAVYALTAIALMFMRDFVIKANSRLFGSSEAESRSSIQNYLTNYKLLITVFNFTPWLVLLLIAN
jgi:hypothetical protein